MRWQTETKELRSRLEAARAPVAPTTFQESELDGLPAPVQRYFRAALTLGQPMIRALHLKHVGTFNTSADGERWGPFESDQRVVCQRPGFDWEARIRMLPGLSVRVHDAYVAGEGILHASLLGLVSMASQRGTPELAQGELLRFLAEAAWYPTALLPSQGVSWQAVDEASARGTLRDGETTASLLFAFDDSGMIETVSANARGRTVGKETVPTPWQGRWSHYAMRHGMRVPLEGEVLWLRPDGIQPYWRGRVTQLGYDFA